MKCQQDAAAIVKQPLQQLKNARPSGLWQADLQGAPPGDIASEQVVKSSRACTCRSVMSGSRARRALTTCSRVQSSAQLAFSKMLCSSCLKYMLRSCRNWSRIASAKLPVHSDLSSAPMSDCRQPLMFSVLCIERRSVFWHMTGRPQKPVFCIKYGAVRDILKAGSHCVLHMDNAGAQPALQACP